MVRSLAKRTHARKSARKRVTKTGVRKRATKTAARKKPRAYAHKHLPVSRRYSYTPELKADVRCRYETTAERVVDLAADCGIHPTTLQRLANREGWLRFAPPPRDLPPAAKLALEVEALAQAPLIPAQAGIQGPDCGPNSSGSPLSRGRADDAMAADNVEPPDRVARLLAAADAELTTVERMRARMQAEPERPADADVTARTLARLTIIVRDLQHMQRAMPHPTGQIYDDLPADLDAFRDALAHRIDALFAGAPDAAADAPPDDAAAAPA